MPFVIFALKDFDIILFINRLPMGIPDERYSVKRVVRTNLDIHPFNLFSQVKFKIKLKDLD